MRWPFIRTTTSPSPCATCRQGETVDVRRAGTIIRAKVTEAIPLGHKFALHALAKGAPVRKYGECIGVATADIATGSHVHVHNMASRRAQKTT